MRDPTGYLWLFIPYTSKENAVRSTRISDVLQAMVFFVWLATSLELEVAIRERERQWFGIYTHRNSLCQRQKQQTKSRQIWLLKIEGIIQRESFDYTSILYVPMPFPVPMDLDMSIDWSNYYVVLVDFSLPLSIEDRGTSTSR